MKCKMCSLKWKKSPFQCFLVNLHLASDSGLKNMGEAMNDKNFTCTNKRFCVSTYICQMTPHQPSNFIESKAHK